MRCAANLCTSLLACLHTHSHTHGRPALLLFLLLCSCFYLQLLPNTECSSLLLASMRLPDMRVGAAHDDNECFMMAMSAL